MIGLDCEFVLYDNNIYALKDCHVRFYVNCFPVTRQKIPVDD